MAESPDAVREAIVETRQDLADTIQALGHKADVKGRVTDKVHEATDKAGAQVRSTAHEVGERVERVDTRTPLLIGLLALVVVVAVPWLRSRRRRR
jgi:hypothetical protein